MYENIMSTNTDPLIDDEPLKYNETIVDENALERI